jgi:hypothetical protein
MSARLLDLARELGVPMRGRHFGSAIGWTTNEDTALQLQRAGARLQGGYNQEGPRGWEISFPEDAEVLAAAAGGSPRNETKQ